ncbi:hypothetical protein OH799_02030 [Nocardia sp. NBC_00881]|nr:hypothetical protein OH799_02030 [Nocardia sp. NBC_00881]
MSTVPDRWDASADLLLDEQERADDNHRGTPDSRLTPVLRRS